eukprot:3123278-Rhodomonas_salina.1
MSVHRSPVLTLRAYARALATPSTDLFAKSRLFAPRVVLLLSLLSPRCIRTLPQYSVGRALSFVITR